MKKTFIVLLACIMAILTLTLTACGDDKNGTYYPTNEEMKTNLEGASYSVEIYKDVYWFDTENGGTEKYESIALRAKNDTGDFIQFYWIESPEACDYYFKKLEETYQDSEILVKIKNDAKFGSIVYCGTKKATDDAGIKIVDVKVKV